MKTTIDTTGLSHEVIHSLTTKIVNIGKETDNESPQVHYNYRTNEMVIMGTASQLKQAKELI